MTTWREHELRLDPWQEANCNRGSDAASQAPTRMWRPASSVVDSFAEVGPSITILASTIISGSPGIHEFNVTK
eukprot:CAMPEP_0198115248 /NCGR_PEP_ID=MMETSP1442-20131203/6413_1 /TAXON_ID= /ORGANISM="Craspedostauros australis, Strain CCMP3328" /LENGTH=72 /DNA_ID=CAMNT_0043772729 /DNA_START=741 /DNA_END=959 /DNA_ORIENTATION=+